MTRPLSVRLEVPNDHRAAATWVLRHAGTIWGIPLKFHDNHAETPDITYTDRPTRGAAWHFNPNCYRQGGAFEARRVDQGLAWAERDGPLDLVGGAFRLLTMLDEASVTDRQRNALGVFDSEALSPGRRGVAHRPVVEHHLRALWADVHTARPDLHETPRWPSGKQWACVLTHDTDAVSLGQLREVAYNFGKLLVRREAVRIPMILTGLRHRRSPIHDPFFGFPGWRDLEEEAGVRSAFFLFVLPGGVRRHLHDSRSSVTDGGVDSDLLRAMAENGWEFGLHASINSRHSPDGLPRSRAILERLLDRRIGGVRHHYWAVDWHRPWHTFRQHADAGFRYDSSIAFRDVPGFRAGTSLPYRPFDPENQRPVDLWELPAAIMDGHLMDPVDDNVVERTLSVVQETRDVGGVLVLNWHTESANQAFTKRGYVDMFRSVFGAVADRSDVWITTPSDLLDHWDARASKSGLRDDAQR